MRRRSAFGLVLLAGLAGWSPGQGRAEAVLRIGIPAEPGTLDPAKSDLSVASEIGADLWQGLVDLDPELRLIPGAAERWEISADGLTHTFHLRAGLRYSNGDPIPAGDFVYSLRHFVDPATAAPQNENLQDLVHADEIIAGKIKDLTQLGVEAPDDRTVVLHLLHPSAMMLFYAVGFYPTRQKDLEHWGAEWTQPGKLVSNGAFMLSERVPEAQVEAVRNKYFWDAGNVRLDRIRYSVVANPKTGLDQFRTGDLDVVELPEENLSWAKANLADTLRAQPMLGITEIAFNQSVAPFKDNPGLRRALALAVDQDILVRNVRKSDDLPAYSFIAPVVKDYPPVVEDFKPTAMADRLREAKALYEAAGYGPDHPLTLSLLVASNPSALRIATAVSTMWRQNLGASISVDAQEFQIAMSALTHRNFTLAVDNWNVVTVPTARLLEVFQSKFPDNETQFRSDAFDDLLVRADAAPDLTGQNRLYAQAEHLLLADQAIIPLYFPITHRLVASRVKGWSPNPADAHRSRFISVD